MRTKSCLRKQRIDESRWHYFLEIFMGNKPMTQTMVVAEALFVDMILGNDFLTMSSESLNFADSCLKMKNGDQIPFSTRKNPVKSVFNVRVRDATLFGETLHTLV